MNLSAGQYLLHSEDEMILPYLPDPLARGVAFVGLPGTTGVFKVPFRPDKRPFRLGKWPDTLPLRLRLQESTAAPLQLQPPPQWDEQAGVLTVFLRKAQVARVRYSCYVNAEDLNLLGVWWWLEQQGKATSERKAAAVEGGCWMLTPFRELALVHAVQQPLLSPSVFFLKADRKAGGTFADYEATMKMDVAGTGKLDVLATWTEKIDDPGDGATIEKGYRETTGKAHVSSHHIENKFGAGKLTFKHEFGDTKHRKVFYYLNASSAFREYFPPEIIKDPNNLSGSTERADYRREVVRSTARPAAPNVLYVVPTFKWSPGKREMSLPSNKKTSSRKGGLRIYLARPWFSSG